MSWFCLGIPPTVAPCGASGDHDRDAEKHTKTTRHGTSSSVRETTRKEEK